jgi:uncharacterized spore protein YtfJ
VSKLEEIVEGASDAIGVRRVFGEPYEKNGVTVIPTARIMGGAGLGQGPATSAGADSEKSAKPTGGGAGFGVVARPAGVFVIKGEQVRWLPAVDVNRIVVGSQIALIVLLLVVRSIFRARAETARTVARESARATGRGLG